MSDPIAAAVVQRIPASSITMNTLLASPLFGDGRAVRIVGVGVEPEGSDAALFLYEFPDMLGPIMQARVLGDVPVTFASIPDDEMARHPIGAGTDPKPHADVGLRKRLAAVRADWEKEARAAGIRIETSDGFSSSNHAVKAAYERAIRDLDQALQAVDRG